MLVRFCFLNWALVIQMCSICEKSSSCTFTVSELVFRVSHCNKFTRENPKHKKLGLDDIFVE